MTASEINITIDEAVAKCPNLEEKIRQEAAGKISMHGYMSEEDKVNVVDEVSDMCAVLGHIVHILGFDFAEMLLRAEAKISGRIDNPDYMRRHPHTEDNN